MDTALAERSVGPEGCLRAIKLFEKCSVSELQRLALHMRSRTCRRGETILFQGLISNQLYLLAAGSVSVLSRKKNVIRYLGDLETGSYFGEISLLGNCAATATIKAAADDTVVYALDYDVIKKVLDSRPELRQDLEEKIRERNQSRQEAFDKEGTATASSPQAG